ncbi:basement membrane-specific heparan sulfate proteoglycan core protein-like [Alosa alosa]|nr:basement membrane-specific heparan sulfate proteoglycan core protein-like [Alosa alosa]
MLKIQDSIDTGCLFLLIFFTFHIYFGNTEDVSTAVLTLEPNRTTIFQGETVHLNCSVKGQNSYDRWYKLQRRNSYGYFTDVTSWVQRSIFEIHHAKDGGIYRCIADSLQSNVLNLTVSGLPKAKLTVEPEVCVFIGETVTLICEIESHRGWTYKWYKGLNPNPVSESEGNTFTISGAGYSDEGQFWCRGERRDRPTASETSGIIVLVVQGLPVTMLTVEPQSPVFTGETVTFKCTIYHFDGWTYKWHKAPSSNPVFESNGNTFTIRGAAESDKGQYWCQGERRDRPTISYPSGSVILKVMGSPPKPTLSLKGSAPVLTGNYVLLTCELQSAGWLFYYYKTTLDSQHVSVSEINSYSINSVKVSDGGQYWCRAGRGDPVFYTQYSDALWVNVTERPKAVVSLELNWTQIFRGETVTLRCNIQTEENHDWEYSWYRNGILWSVNHLYTFTATYVSKDNYTCRGQQKNNQMVSDFSEAFTLNVIEKPKPVLRGPPQTWLTEGDSVTLSCEVRGSTTGWRFHWYRYVSFRNRLPTVTYGGTTYYLELLSNGERETGGSYTLSPAALRHTGVYVCRAERGEPAYHTEFSDPQPLFITGVPSASLVIKPNRTQHFTGDSLSLSCEVQGNSTGWRLRWFTKKPEISQCPYSWTAASGPRCHTVLYSYDSGVYWCQSDNSKYSHIVNITVHNGPVIIDSPAYPVTEGDPLSLRCVYRSQPADFHANFFKDSLPLKNHTSGEMTITAVSRKDEGYYQCDNTQGISLTAYVTVKASFSEPGSSHVLVAVSVVLVTLLILVIMLALLFCSKKVKGLHDHTTFAHQDQSLNDQTQHLNQQGCTHLESDITHVYDTVNMQNGGEDEDTTGSTTDLTYAQLELKPIKNKQKINSDEHVPSDVIYAKVNITARKPKNKGEDQPPNGDVTYATVNVKAKELSTKDH